MVARSFRNANHLCVVGSSLRIPLDQRIESELKRRSHVPDASLFDPRIVSKFLGHG